jgi:hypothetical protein
MYKSDAAHIASLFPISSQQPLRPPVLSCRRRKSSLPHDDLHDRNSVAATIDAVWCFTAVKIHRCMFSLLLALYDAYMLAKLAKPPS